MPASYNLDPHFEGFVQRLVASGRYASAGEVLREGLRLLEEREAAKQARLEALRKDMDLALESGPSERLDLEDIKSEGRRLMAG